MAFFASSSEAISMKQKPFACPVCASVIILIDSTSPTPEKSVRMSSSVALNEMLPA